MATLRKNQKKHNLTYEDIEDIVEYLVKTKAYGYTFDVYTQDDIAQEIRIICLNALNKLDLDRVKDGKLQNFFGRCVDNSLKNLKRDNYVRASSPYRKKFDNLSSDDNSPEAKEIREKFAHHQDGVKRKLAIMHPSQVDGLAELIKNKRFQQEMEYKDLEEYLIEVAPSDILAPLKLILSGHSKKVSRKEKRKVQKFVKSLDIS